MKTELKAKFLQHLSLKKRNDEGFTLIELLVVIIIIGILSAIALPSFLNQANKGKQSEAKQYAGSLNRAQQAYYVENTVFATSVDALNIGIKSQTTNYIYSITATSTPNAVATNRGLSQKAGLKSYAGVVAVSTVGANSETTSTSLLCESTSASPNPAVNAPTTGTCPDTFTELK